MWSYSARYLLFMGVGSFSWGKAGTSLSLSKDAVFSDECLLLKYIRSLSQVSNRKEKQKEKEIYFHFLKSSVHKKTKTFMGEWSASQPEASTWNRWIGSKHFIRKASLWMCLGPNSCFLDHSSFGPTLTTLCLLHSCKIRLQMLGCKCIVVVLLVI